MILIVGIIFLLLVIGIPVAFAFFLPVVFGMKDLGLTMEMVSGLPYTTVASFPLIAIPLFILLGELMNQAGLIDKLINLAELFLKKLKGSLGYITVVCAAFLGAITGSSVATVAAISSTMGKRMMNDGYKKEYVASLTAAVGLLGVLIPPSIPLILYGSIANVSISDLFLATLVPGIIMTLTYILVHKLLLKGTKTSVVKMQSKDEIATTIEMKSSPFQIFKSSLPALFLPVIVLGGIYGGIFTATEAAAVAAVYALIIYIVNRKPKGKSIYQIFLKAGIVSATILLLISFTSIFNRVIVLEQIPQVLTEMSLSITDNKYVFLLMVVLILLIVGMFMETNTAVLLMAPLLFPVALSYGIDPIHFGIALVTNIEIGLLTPPMAANLYVSAKINQVPVMNMLKYTFIFLGASIFVLLLITFFPIFTTWFL